MYKTYISFEMLKGSRSGDFGGGGGASSCKTLMTPALPSNSFDFLTWGCGIFTFTGATESEGVKTSKIIFIVPADMIH